MLKKLFLFLIALNAHVLLAEPVGSPISPTLINSGILIPCDYSIDVRIGFIGDCIFDRRLKQHDEGRGRVDEFTVYATSGILTLNFVDRLDIYATLGSGDIDAQWRVSTPSGLTHVHTKTHQDFTWMVGTNIVLLEWGRASLGMGGLYRQMNPGLSRLTIDGVSQDIATANMDYSEWQLNSGFSYQLDFLIPYIGMKFSSASSSIQAPGVSYLAENGGSINHFESRDFFGLYLGFTITNRRILMVNIETRLIDEEAVTVLADFRF